MQQAEEGPLRDCVIAASQLKVEHVEIAGRKTLVTDAQQMGQQEVVDLLQRNLRQEQETAENIEQTAPQLEQQALQTA